MSQPGARSQALLLIALALSAGCSRLTNLFDDRAHDAAVSGGAGDGATPRDGGRTTARDGGRDASASHTFTFDGGQVYCGTTLCICANGLDDDLDGLIDGFDPECTGAYDADESSFGTGAPGTDRVSKCEDCFFDDNNGPGDDGCRYPATCLLGNEPSGGACGGSCEPAASCVNSCLPRTPNGCDCFGCCEIRQGSVVLNVLLNDRCSLQELDDVTKCPRCEQSPTCRNACGTCELCPGKTLADLEASCASEPDGYSCDVGEVCGPSRGCGDLGYCQLGCCVPIAL